jgi:hypothetical protein
MKSISRFFVLGLALMLPLVQAQAAAEGVRSAVSQMQTDVAAAKDKESFVAASKAFFSSLESVSASDRASAVKELKSGLTYDAQRKVDALIAAADAGVLSQDEINARAVEIAKSSAPTGAAWDGNGALVTGGVVLVILGALLITVGGGGGGGYYYDPFCYWDYYYGYVCY